LEKGGEKMKRLPTAILITCISVLVIFTGTSFVYANTDYGDVTLSGGSQSGNFPQVWDLTQHDLVISFTYDANGLVDDAGAHAWAELGIRDTTTASNFNPTWMVEGKGVWLATDYDWTANTFDPDPVGSPTLDLDDKLILQKGGGMGEGAYNLPSTPPSPGNNHRFWFDRDGVDQWQDDSPLAVDGGTYNTGGTLDVVITLHKTSDNTGEAFMTINGLNQGFETDGNWNTMELTPAGMTFTGDMKHMQVFYGLYGYGAEHSVAFKEITVEGTLWTIPASIDIKPGDGDTNPINLNAKGVVPVAVLSTGDFDASTIDTATVLFAGVAPVKYVSEDVNGDTNADMLFFFDNKSLILDANSTSATLTALTNYGQPIEGTDSVNIVPSKK
jgi:hypothetical protein